jgi:hypothetical protein
VEAAVKSVKAILESWSTEALFLVPYWGMNPAMASGCGTGPPAYVALRACTTTRRHSRLHPPARDQEYGYCKWTDKLAGA